MGQPLRVARPSDYTPANASVAVAQQLMMAQGMTDPALLAQIQQNMQQQITGGAAGVAPPAGVAAAPTPTTVLILTNLVSHGLQLQSLWIIPTAAVSHRQVMAYSCKPRWKIPAAAVSEHVFGRAAGRRRPVGAGP